MEALLAALTKRNVGGRLPGAGGVQPSVGADPDVRLHLDPRAYRGRQRKRGQKNAGLGRSRGRCGTKIQLKADRDAARHRGIVPVIRYRSNAKNPPKVFPKMLYRARARVEHFIGKLKRFRRVAMRCVNQR